MMHNVESRKQCLQYQQQYVNKIININKTHQVIVAHQIKYVYFQNPSMLSKSNDITTK